MNVQLQRIHDNIEYCKVRLKTEPEGTMRIQIATEGERLNRLYLDLVNQGPGERCCTKCLKLKPVAAFRLVTSRVVRKDGSVRTYTGRRKYCNDCHNKQCYRPYKKRLSDVSYIF